MSIINKFKPKMNQLKNDLEFQVEKILSLKVMYLQLNKEIYKKEIKICNNIIDSLTNAIDDISKI